MRQATLRRSNIPDHVLERLGKDPNRKVHITLKTKQELASFRERLHNLLESIQDQEPPAPEHTR